jgi:hypothetical protein
MIVLVDIGRGRSRVGLLREGDVRWFAYDEANVLAPLKEALASGSSGRVTHVAALRYPDAADAALRPSWTGVRGATTVANSLAFAWHVPAVDVLAGGEDDATVVAAAVAACHAAEGGAVARSDYDGLPNITKPKGTA